MISPFSSGAYTRRVSPNATSARRSFPVKTGASVSAGCSVRAGAFRISSAKTDIGSIDRIISVVRKTAIAFLIVDPNTDELFIVNILSVYLLILSIILSNAGFASGIGKSGYT